MLQEQDRNVVTRQISVIDQGLSQLEAVEFKLTGELDAIRTKIGNLRDQRAALESRIAAVWCLPNEILSYIFELGAMMEEEEVESKEDKDMDEEADDVPDKVAFQILVSQVCRMFREVAIRTPSLWTQIHILDLAPPRLDFVRTCVERSGSLTLDILIDYEDPRLESDLIPIQSLMAILSPQTWRFERFTARLPGFPALHCIMQSLDLPAPQLETLDLSDSDYEHAFDEDDPFEPPALREPLTLFDGVVPKLTRVSLDGAHVSWGTAKFANLIALHLGYHTRDVRPSYDEFKTIIEASPTLRSLDLRGSAPLLSEDNTALPLYTPLRMDRLEGLTISDIPSDYATTLISLLHAPNLKSLALTDLDTNDYSTFLKSISGPPAMFPTLTALKIATIEVEDEAFEGFLRAFPTVTDLALYFQQMPPRWLSYLERKEPAGEILCPNLKSLRCVSVSPYDIKKVLQNRREAGFPIAKLQIDKESVKWATTPCMQWIKDNTAVEIFEPSEYGSDDEDLGSASEWRTDEDDEDEFEGFPVFGMEGFSDEEEDEEEEEEDEDEDSGMDVDNADGTDGSTDGSGEEE